MTKLNTTNDVDKQMHWVMKRIEALPEPNKSYVLSFKRSLEVLGKKKLTVTKRLGEAVRIFELLGDKDLKTATREDIEELVLKIITSSKRTHQAEKPIFLLLLSPKTS